MSLCFYDNQSLYLSQIYIQLIKNKLNGKESYFLIFPLHQCRASLQHLVCICISRNTYLASIQPKNTWSELGRYGRCRVVRSLSSFFLGFQQRSQWVCNIESAESYGFLCLQLIDVMFPKNLAVHLNFAATKFISSMS